MKALRLTVHLTILLCCLVSHVPISAEISKWTFKSSGISFDAELLYYNQATNQAVFKNKAGKQAQLNISLFVDSDADKIKAFTNSAKVANTATSNPINTSDFKPKSLALKTGWAAGVGKADGAGEELLSILAGNLGVSPSINLESSEDAFVYPGIRYLEDLKIAVAIFFSKDPPLSAKKFIASPGLPASSIYSYDFKTDVVDNFAEYDSRENISFTHVSFVVDSKDQVICIYFLNNEPKTSSYVGNVRPDGTVYNFIDFRRKASSTYQVERKITYCWSKFKIFKDQYGQIKENPTGGDAIIKLEHELIDGRGKSREHNRLYLPLKFAGIIVHLLNQ